MRRFPVEVRAALPAADRALGKLGPALVWLATAQGGWPPRRPQSVHRMVVDQGTFEDGLRLADELADAGTDLLVLSSGGDQVPGIVVAAALLDLEPVQAVGTAAGPGWAAAIVGVRDGLRGCRPFLGDPAGLLDAVGCPALSRLTGLLAQSAVRRTPVVLDGSPLICGAALVAERFAPGAAGWWLAGQGPPVPAARAALADLDLVPLLELGLALPQGAELALSVLEQALDLVLSP